MAIRDTVLSPLPWRTPMGSRVGSPVRLFLGIGLVYAAVTLAGLALLVAPARLTLGIAPASPTDVRVTWLQAGGSLWQAGVRVGDHVLDLNGQPPPPRGRALWVGRSARVRQGGQRPRMVAAEHLQPYLVGWPLLVLSPWFVALGLLVLRRAPQPAVGRATCAVFVSAACSLSLAPASLAGNLLACGAIYPLVALFCWCFVRLFLIVPVRRSGVRLQALLSPPLIGAAVASLAQNVWPALYGLTDPLIGVITLLYLLLGAGLLAYSVVTTRDRAMRVQLWVMAVGTAAAVLPLALLTVLPELLNTPDLLQPEVAGLSLALLPASFTYAILHHGAFGLQHLLYRWMVHLCLVLALVALAVGCVALPSLLGVWSRLDTRVGVTLSSLLALLVGATGTSLQRWLWPRLDRRLFHDQYDYRRVLRVLSQDFAQGTDLQAVITGVPPRLCQMMNLQFATLSVSPSSVGPGVAAEDLDTPSTPLPTAPQTLAGACPRTPHACGAAVIVPLRLGAAVLGQLTLGPKANGEPFRPEDQDLLATLSGPLATLIHNTRLQQTVQKDARDRQAHTHQLTAQGTALRVLNDRLRHAHEDERARLAGDLHDGPLQLVIHLQSRLTSLAPGAAPDADLLALSKTVSRRLREVCVGLGPSAVRDLGLRGALDALAAEVSARCGVAVLVAYEADLGHAVLTPAAQEALYRAAQEGVTNAVRHAQAGIIHVSAQRHGALVTVLVSDDGQGFTVPTDLRVLADHGHLGLAAAQRRLEQVGGRLSLCSARGQATVLRAEAPVAGSAP